MNRVKPVRNTADQVIGHWFICPGCGENHMPRTGVDGGPSWSFNGNLENPTFTPSLLVRGTLPLTDEQADAIMRGEKVAPKEFVCHSFITDGRIQFLTDCTHPLAGQTVELPILTDS